jgi:hypothetical protein
MIQDFFVGKHYFAIPIKILDVPTNPSIQAKQVEEYPRVVSCSDIDSVEIDGTLCPNFRQVISNIMSMYPDVVSEAAITDNQCMCDGGVEYEFDLVHKVPTRYLKIHLWRAPTVLVPEEINDIMYVDFIYPDNMGVVPFRGHMPVELTSEQLQTLDLDYATNTCNSIFQKNGFLLSSNDRILPQNLEVADILNILKVYPSPSVDRLGNSDIDPTTNLSRIDVDFIHYPFLPSSNSVTIIQKSYVLGYALAHEFIHQMVRKSMNFIGGEAAERYGNSVSYSGGHIDNRVNLLVAGDYFTIQGATPGIQDLTIKEKEDIKKWRSSSLDGSELLYGNLIPKSNSNETSRWERISPTHKLLISSGVLASKCEAFFGKNSCESTCCKKILASKIKNVNFIKYDPY